MYVAGSAIIFGNEGVKKGWIDPIAQAGLPIVLHVGGGGVLLEKQYFNNGLPPVPDFHGGDDNFKSIDYMAIAYPPMKAMTALIVDYTRRLLSGIPGIIG